MRTLPQGLQDMIFDYTCTVERSATNFLEAQPTTCTPDHAAGAHVDERYRPPLYPHTPGVRAPFARYYYSNTAFTFKSRALLVRWVLALPPEHRAWLTGVRYDSPEWSDSELNVGWNEIVWNELIDIEEELWVNGVLLRHGKTPVMYMRSWDFEQECWDW